MSTPRAPRKSVVPVDQQLDDFETSLRIHLAYQMMVNVDLAYWQELDEPDPACLQTITRAIDCTFEDLCTQYEKVESVSDLLEHLRILIQNSVWASMNVPYPRSPGLHMDRVIDNALRVYFEVVYANLRTEMIMANHNAEVLQRTWRRCISDPSHPVCRRRLEYEFAQMAN